MSFVCFVLHGYKCIFYFGLLCCICIVVVAYGIGVMIGADSINGASQKRMLSTDPKHDMRPE